MAGNDARGGFGRLGRLAGLVAAGAALRDAYRQQADSDEDSPRSVILEDRSEAICARALELAEEGRDDQPAVSELRRMSGRHVDDLKIADRAVRVRGAHHSSPEANLAHRLLVAALSGGVVSPVDAADAPLLAWVQHMRQLSQDGQWEEVASRQPALREVEQGIIEGEITGGLDLSRRLTTLVGPNAATEDAVLRSEAAYFAVGRLWELLPQRHAEPVVEQPGETLWDHLRDSRYLDLCIVCGQPASWNDDDVPTAWLTRPLQRGREGRAHPVHRSCWATGSERAAAEGIGWEEQPSEGRPLYRRH